ncbi:Probable inactive dual specificity protein phosphatase-like [Striga hermonthica]|uniref:Probable inactive dual specificity protein phosphatase-like n=1 Tax=Striga hermonthica TaxID=68872 RepID=A0A9N7MYI4_STRHE|nr:Probable inactive dual specificity protein phosphatase-like [Striga hermonthica]
MATPMEGAPDNVDLGSVAKPSLIYRCKKCRRIVATEEYIIPHNRGEGQKGFRGKRRNADLELEAPVECSSIFVEPMKWMQTLEEGYLGDKLQCFGCKARLGSFSWVGMQCSCGRWINPAFQLHKSRLDECSV